MVAPDPLLAPVIAPVIAPIVHANDEETLDVKPIFGPVPLQVAAVEGFVTEGLG
jgi:hypothetical protein